MRAGLLAALLLTACASPCYTPHETAEWCAYVQSVSVFRCGEPRCILLPSDPVGSFTNPAYVVPRAW